MWAWLIQRAAAVLLLLVIAAHLVNPFRRGVQAALLALALLHGLLGVRSLVLDSGVPLRWHRALFAAALALSWCSSSSSGRGAGTRLSRVETVLTLSPSQSGA